MGIPEHNLCVRSHKLDRKGRRKAIAQYGMKPGKYLRKGKCKTWRKFRLRQVIDFETDMGRRDSLKSWNVSTVRELWNVLGLRYGRYGKYDD